MHVPSWSRLYWRHNGGLYKLIYECIGCTKKKGLISARGACGMFRSSRIALFGGLSALIYMFSVATSSAAEKIATIEIYRVPIRFVCGTTTYTNPPNCTTFTAADFERLKNSHRLSRVYQADLIPPVANRFVNNLVRESREYDDFSSTARTDAALVVVNWLGTAPRGLEIRREDFEGNELATDGPFRRKLGPGRFFYHFPFEQVGRLILTLQSSSPRYQITYSP
jgi:hypothetical protein